MKTLLRRILLTAGLAVAALPVIRAADAPTATPLAGDQPGLPAPARRQAVRQRIAQRLGLTADQIAQLKATRAKTVTAIKAIRADTTLNADQQKAKIHETRLAARAEMRNVLTPDQKQKMGKIRAFVRGRISARPPA